VLSEEPTSVYLACLHFRAFLSSAQQSSWGIILNWEWGKEIVGRWVYLTILFTFLDASPLMS
jgi:hypothetical protein